MLSRVRACFMRSRAWLCFMLERERREKERKRERGREREGERAGSISVRLTSCLTGLD
jgi:hypothetical protein